MIETVQGGFTLDRESAIPLYYQLASAIRERIQSGVLAVGDQLPAERDLAREAGISRMTARQALADLTVSSDVIVRHGVGTFVAAPKLTHDALHLLGFSEEMARLGGEVSSRVLECALVTPPPAIAAALDLAEWDMTVRVARLRLAGATPLLLETSYLPHARCPGLEREDLERQSLYGLLETRYGHRLRTARQTIEAATASTYERDLLAAHDGAAMLVLEGVTVTESGWPIEWFRAIYRGDRVKIAIESQRKREMRHATDLPSPVSVLLT